MLCSRSCLLASKALAKCYCKSPVFTCTDVIGVADGHLQNSSLFWAPSHETKAERAFRASLRATQSRRWAARADCLLLFSFSSASPSTACNTPNQHELRALVFNSCHASQSLGAPNSALSKRWRTLILLLYSILKSVPH